MAKMKLQCNRHTLLLIKVSLKSLKVSLGITLVSQNSQL